MTQSLLAKSQLGNRRDYGSYKPITHMTPHERAEHANRVRWGGSVGRHYADLHAQHIDVRTFGRDVKSMYAPTGSGPEIAQAFHEVTRPSARHKNLHYGISVTDGLAAKVDKLIDPKLLHTPVAFHHAKLTDGVVAAGIGSHVTTGNKGRVLINSTWIDPHGKPLKDLPGPLRDILSHELVHATTKKKNPLRNADQRMQPKNPLSGIGEEARADALGSPHRPLYYSNGYIMSNRKTHVQAGKYRAKYDGVIPAEFQHGFRTNHRYNEVFNAIRNAKKIVKAVSMSDVAKADKKRIATDAAFGAALGGSKAFGARAGAGEALDWSKHFQTKFPKIKPVASKLDMAAKVVHDLPRGPLLATGVAAGAIAGGAYGARKKVAKRLKMEHQGKRVTWTDGYHHRDELGRFAAVGSAASVGVAGVYGSKANKARKHLKFNNKKVKGFMGDVADDIRDRSSGPLTDSIRDLDDTMIRHTGHDYIDNATHYGFEHARLAQRFRYLALRNAKVAGTAGAIGLALGGASQALQDHPREVAKFVSPDDAKKKASKLKRALNHVRITPEQARQAGVMGQVGTAGGAVAGTIVGTGIGIGTKHPAQGAGLGGAIGGSAGGGIGAALGLRSGRKVHKAADQTASDKWEKRTANGLNVVGGAADAVAIKTGYQATKRAFKTKLPEDASRAAKLDHFGNKTALPLAISGLAAAGINAHLINRKPKETPVTKNDINVEEVFKFARETKKGAAIGASVNGVAGLLQHGNPALAVLNAGAGAAIGGGIGAAVAHHRNKKKAALATEVQRNASLAAPVAKNMDVEEIFKLSRDAKIGAGVGAGLALNRYRALAPLMKESTKVFGKKPLVAGIAAGTAANAGLGAGVGGIIHGVRTRNNPQP